MSKLYTYNALAIKADLIDFFIKMYGDVVIGSELIYGADRKVVDLFLLHQGSTYAIEVKSEFDSLKRLESQVGAYCSTFDYVYIAVCEKFVESVRAMVPESVGIIVPEPSHRVHIVRRARKQQKLSKFEILSSVNSSFLKSNSPFPGIDDIDMLRARFQKRSLRFVEDLYYRYLEEKTTEKYKLFLSQRGECTHPDDVFLLSFSSLFVV